MEIYLSIQEVAELEGVTRQWVNKRALAGQYIYRETYGSHGKKIMIRITAAEEPELYLKWRIKNQGIYNMEALSMGTCNVPLQTARENKELVDLPGPAQNEALKRYAAIAEYYSLTQNGMAKIQAAGYAAGKAGITLGTFYRWLGAYDPEQSLASLAPQYKYRAGAEKPDRGLSKDAGDYLKALYLSERRLTFTKCFRLLKRKAAAEGWEIPSEASARRYIKDLPPAAICLMREGEKKYRDNYEPYAERDYTSIDPMDWVVADHRELDLFVRHKGRVFRPWLTAWMDVRSRKYLAGVVSESPSSDTIYLATRRMIERYGIPRVCYTDNGKDFRAHALAGPGRKKIRVELPPEAQGIYRELGSRLSLALPYNAQGKPIERQFRNNSMDFDKAFVSYTGNKPGERPATLKKLDTEAYPTLESVAAYLEKWLTEVYNQRSHSGQGMDGRSPDEVFATRTCKRTLPRKELLYLLLKKKLVTVGRNGVKLHETWFWHDILTEFQGAKMMIHYDPLELKEIHLFDLNGNFVATLIAQEKALWGRSEREIASLKRIRRKQREIIREAAAVKDIAELSIPELLEFDAPEKEVCPSAAPAAESAKVIEAPRFDVKRMTLAQARAQEAAAGEEEAQAQAASPLDRLAAYNEKEKKRRAEEKEAENAFKEDFRRKVFGG